MHIEMREGQPVETGMVRFPWIQGGFIWNRPHSIMHQSSDGEVKEMRIWDVTRLVQFLVLSVGIIASLFMARKKNRN
jgi:hypothetical protein